MQIGQTNLQEQRQNEQTANNMLAAAPASINPNNANVDPWQGVRDSANEYIKTSRTVTPPSEGEIHKRMWESSMMTGLIITLATGNVAGGLAAGMWGAVAVHDYGYTLRQRAEHVPQLQAEGYSMPAILKWYEDGDNSELDKERTEKEKVREFDLSRQDQRDQFAATEEDKRLDRERLERQFNAGQALQRAQIGEQKRHNLAMEDNARSATGAQIRADDRNAIRETQKLFEGAKARQGNLDQAHTTIEVLRDAVKRGDKADAAAAYNEARTELARAFAGGGATLTPEQLREFSGMPAWVDDKTNAMGLAVNGMPTELAVNVLASMAKIGRESEMKTILSQGAKVYEGFKSQGMTDEDAQRRTAIATQGTGVGHINWAEELSTQNAGQEQQEDQKTTGGKEYTSSNGIKFTVSK